MRVLWLVLLVLLVGAATMGAQPLYGNLVLSLLNVNSLTGAVIYVDPNNPSTVNTLTANVVRQNFTNWVRMAPDNNDLVIAETDQSFSRMLRVDPGGVASTIVNFIPGGIQGFELDGDNIWIVAAASTSLFGVDHTSGKWYSYSLVAQWPTFNEVCILREQGHKYIVANFTTSTGAVAKFYSLDRSGLKNSLMVTAGEPLLRLAGVEVDPKTGDLITVDFNGPATVPPEPNNGVEINRVTLGGKVTTLTTFGVNGAKVNQDDTAWIGGFQRGTTNTTGVLKYDLNANAVVTMVLLPTVPLLMGISTVEVYGSHPLTCNGQGGPGKTIYVTINSKNPFATSAFYQIACSFARRPGIRFTNGEWLHLNVTDPLFILTVQNLAPFIFKNFQGQLNPFGSANARIDLPGNFPGNLNLTVFCAAVIYQKQGVIEVTNTHWFEL